MKYRIVHYIMPWEIDDLERQAHQLILSSYHLSNDTEIIFDCTLNISDNIIDWDLSKMTKEYFIEKYKYIEILLSNYFIVEFDTDLNVKGCVDKRRSVANKEQDFIIWLDPDIYFSGLTLAYMVHTSVQLEGDEYILTPEIIKYWDHTWDCLTHSKFLDEPTNHRDNFDLYSLDELTRNNEISLTINNRVKLGGGWFNLFTSKVFKRIVIPDELGSYGWEDLYVMLCATHLKIPQYILRGVVVSEIGKRFTEGKDYLKGQLTIKKENVKWPNFINNNIKINDEAFNSLIIKFYNENK